MANINEISMQDAQGLSNDYNPRFNGAIVKNGDVCTGEIIKEDNKIFYVCKDKTGNLYETEEQPYILLDLTITQFMGVWFEKDIEKYKKEN